LRSLERRRRGAEKAQIPVMTIRRSMTAATQRPGSGSKMRKPMAARMQKNQTIPMRIRLFAFSFSNWRSMILRQRSGETPHSAKKPPCFFKSFARARPRTKNIPEVIRAVKMTTMLMKMRANPPFIISQSAREGRKQRKKKKTATNRLRRAMANSLFFTVGLG